MAYSLQSHLRTTVPDVGQIETNELYVSVRNSGQQFIIPVLRNFLPATEAACKDLERLRELNKGTRCA